MKERDNVRPIEDIYEDSDVKDMSGKTSGFAIAGLLVVLAIGLLVVLLTEPDGFKSKTEL